MLLNRKIDLNSIFLVLLALVFSTIMRISLLGMYPILVVIFLWLFRFRFSGAVFILLGLIGASWLLSLRHGFYLKYNLVSFYYYLTFIILLFARPTARQFRIDPLPTLMKGLTVFALINDAFGFMQYIKDPSDDSFVGIYGKFTVTQNGLVLLNNILFFWYLQLYQQSKKQLHLWAAFFFIICTVLGFYGAGLMVLFGTFALFYVKFSFKSLFRLLFTVIIVGVIIYFVMKIISPNTLQYNINIFNKFWNASLETAPRKLLIFYRYITNYPPHIIDCLFGSGPGTFNSRSAFVVGSPSYFNIEFIKSDSHPEYFYTLAYPLWNPDVVTRYDGFMSQPFTSVLAFLGEYGVLTVVLFFTMAIKQFKQTLKLAQNRKAKGLTFHGKLYKLLTFFILLLCVIDNYIEYPEVTGLLLVILKLTEQRIVTESAMEELAVAA